MMIELPVVISPIPNTNGLTTALQAALGANKVLGISTYGDGRPISVFLQDGVSQADQNTAIALAGSHDPVFLACDKTRVSADDTDRCTITVNAPKPGNAPVVLSISINNNPPVDLPVPLTAGIGSDYFTCKDQGTIVVTVKNGQNRSGDQLVIEAV